MQPTISEITFEPVSIPLITNFAVSGADHPYAHNIIIRVLLDNGVQGFGEAAPFPKLTGDSQSSALEILAELSALATGSSLAEVFRSLDSPLRQEFMRSPTALAGLETALWDAHCRSLDIPMRDVLGPSSHRALQTDLTIPILPTDESIAFWHSMAHLGFRTVKFKVGSQETDQDLDRVIKLTKLLPPGTSVIIDGNQGFTVTSALDFVLKLQNQGIEPHFFEQPLREDDWQGMVALTKSSPIAICADESVRNATDALRLVQDKAAHWVNLKFMKSGLRECQRIAAICTAAKIPLMLGGMVESEVGMTASLHFACGLGKIQWLDLDTPFFFSQSALTEDNPFNQGTCQLTLPRGSGLGLNASTRKET